MASRTARQEGSICLSGVGREGAENPVAPTISSRREVGTKTSLLCCGHNKTDQEARLERFCVPSSRWRSKGGASKEEAKGEGKGGEEEKIHRTSSKEAHFFFSSGLTAVDHDS